jgi:transposase
VQVETFKIGKPSTTLASVYEQQKKEHSTRKLEVNFLRPDFFILSGMQRVKKFHVRAEFKDGEVRGMTLQRESLVGEQKRIINRMKATLIRLGIRGFNPKLKKAADPLEGLRTAEGEP